MILVFSLLKKHDGFRLNTACLRNNLPNSFITKNMVSVEVSVDRWSAWLPGITTDSALKAWADDQLAIDLSQTPDISFLPPNQRRRLSLLSKMVLFTAHTCSDNEKVATVCCSRYGEFSRTVTLLKDLAAKEPLSPTAFSQSVHNTALGLFSISNQNIKPATAIASCEDTFPMGFIEAAAMLLSGRQEKVLLVMADEVPEAPYLAYSEGGIPYAIAILLSLKKGKQDISLLMKPNSESVANHTH